MNYFVLFSSFLIFMSYFPKFSFFCLFVLPLFIAKYRYKNLNDLLKNTVICLLIFTISFLIKNYLIYKNGELVIQYESLPFFIEGMYNLKIYKIRATYVILEYEESYKLIVSRGKVDENQIFEGTKVRAFIKAHKVDNIDNSFYLSNKIFYKIDSIDVVEIKNEGLLQVIRLYINDRLSGDLRVLKGIVFGAEDLSYWERKELIEAGIYHFFVASGSNVMLIMNLGFHIFRLILTNNLAIIFSVLLTFFYCLVVGFDPPLTRAFVFALFLNVFFISDIKDKLFYSILSVLFVWLFFLFIDFYSTLGLSFKLSFISFLGVIFVGSIIRDILKEKISDFFIDNFAINLGVMIFTFPVLVNYFGIFYLNGIFSNIIIAFILPFVFYLTLIYLVFPFSILVYVFNIFGFIIDVLTKMKAFYVELKIEKVFVILYYFFLIMAGNLVELIKIKK